MSSIISRGIILLYNIAQLFGWLLVLKKTMTLVVNDDYKVLQDATLVKILEVVQTVQFLDILFALLGISTTKIGPSLIHLTGRNLVVWFVFPYASDSIYPSFAIIPWCLADCIRFANYISDSLALKIHLLKALRYNAFIVLYPAGLTGEYLSAGDAKKYIQNHKKDEHVNILGHGLPIKVLWILITFRYIAYPGLAYMYLHMLKLRSRFYHKEQVNLAFKKHAQAQKSKAK